jgi:uncharacterized protein involved in tolerance to divalent cations
MFAESFNMINIYIHLDSQKDARSLVTALIERNLLAHASIGKDNHSMQKVEGAITERTNYVITGQTKALLFNQIISFIDSQGVENCNVYSVPITQTNKNFGEIIRDNTLKI